MVNKPIQKRRHQSTKRSQILKGDQRAILLMTCLFVAILVIFSGSEESLTWLFLIVVVLAIAPQNRRYKNLAKVRRALKTIADLRNL